MDDATSEQSLFFFEIDDLRFRVEPPLELPHDYVLKPDDIPKAIAIAQLRPHLQTTEDVHTDPPSALSILHTSTWWKVWLDEALVGSTIAHRQELAQIAEDSDPEAQVEREIAAAEHYRAARERDIRSGLCTIFEKYGYVVIFKEPTDVGATNLNTDAIVQPSAHYLSA